MTAHEKTDVFRTLQFAHLEEKKKVEQLEGFAASQKKAINTLEREAHRLRTVQEAGGYFLGDSQDFGGKP